MMATTMEQEERLRPQIYGTAAGEEEQAKKKGFSAVGLLNKERKGQGEKAGLFLQHARNVCMCQRNSRM